MTVTEGDMIRMDELLYLYRLKESKEVGYYEPMPWDRKARFIASLPSLFCYWKSRYFFVSRDGWETLSDDLWGDVPRLLHRWGTPKLGVSYFISFFFFLFFFFFFLKVSALVCLTLSPHISLFLATKARPKLKSRYKNRVKSVVDYTKTIEDFDELIVPRMLAHHFLGPEPSLYVLRTTAIE